MPWNNDMDDLQVNLIVNNRGHWVMLFYETFSRQASGVGWLFTFVGYSSSENYLKFLEILQNVIYMVILILGKAVTKL